MRYYLLPALLIASMSSFAQQDSTDTDPLAELRNETEKNKPVEKPYTTIFQSPRLINANTVETIRKGILEFKVTHNFGDIGGDAGGAKNFYGMDNATDIRIGFQYGLTDNINLTAARTKGAGGVQQQYELGVKYRFLRQVDNDRSHPISMAIFGNAVVSAMKASPGNNDENSFDDFGDRTSQTLQLMVAKKMGRLSLELLPTVVNRGYVTSYDDNTLFAMGGAARLQITKRYSLLVDYFHTFRSDRNTEAFKQRGIHFRDALGVGFEVVTEGHVFHLNFTNATEILENRFIPRTITSWGKGQFRWGFTISRDFNLLWKKKNRKK